MPTERLCAASQPSLSANDATQDASDSDDHPRGQRWSVHRRVAEDKVSHLDTEIAL